MVKINLVNNKNTLGISMLEIVLSMTIFAIIAVSALPFFMSLIAKNKLDSTKLLAAQGVRRAMMKAQAAEADSAWGLKLMADKIVVFSGDNYINRNGQYDQVMPIDYNVVFSGDTELVFGKLTGELAADKSFVIMVQSTGESKTVSVNRYGALTY